MISDPHDLSALIAALEAAAVGSRELDERIALCVGWAVQPDGQMQAGMPAYSTNLDASLRLAPIGMQWEVSTSSFHDGTDAFQAYVYDYGSRGHTPALAMCSAALRSRSAG